MSRSSITRLVLGKQGQSIIEPILNSISTGIIIINAEGQVVYVNHTCEELLDINFEAITGMHYNEVFAKIPTEERFTLITLKTGREFKNAGSEKARFNNLYVTTDTVLLRDEQGNTIGAAGIFKNITPIHDLHNQLRESSKLSMLGNLAAGMAHEILNPLTTCRGLVQILKQKAVRDNLPAEKVIEYAGIIMSELETISGLIKSFTYISKFKPVDMKPVDLTQLVHSAAELVIGQMREKQIRLETNLHAGAAALGDTISLKQALLHLLDNSLEILPTGGMINITTGVAADEALIIVSDDGPGIKPELMDDIFTPFFTTREGKTGLGLAITKRIIHSHKGHMRAESRPGGGARFIISLPLADSGQL